MKNIQNSPAFIFLVFILIGFIPSSITQFNLILTFLLTFCFIIIALFLYHFSKKYRFAQHPTDFKNYHTTQQNDNSINKKSAEVGNLFTFASYAMIAVATGLLISYQARSDYMIDSKVINKEFKGYFSGYTTKILVQNPKFTRILANGEIRLQNFDKLMHQTIYLTIFKQPNDTLLINSGDRITALIRFKYPREANLPQEFDEQNYLKYLDADFSATCSAKSLHFQSKNYSASYKERILNAINENINKMYSPNTAGIAKALTIGDKSDISKELRDNFSITGTAHILAVSGLHVGIIAGAIIWLFSFLKNDWLKFVMTILSLWAYLFLIDYPASAVRASLMIALYLFATTIQRQATPLNIVSATAVFIIIISPKITFNTGFQMSMGAILGITIFFEPIRNFFKQFFKKDNSFNKYLINSLALTFSSSIIVSPIVAYYFNIYSIISPLANLVSIPMMVGAQVLTLISLLLSFIYLPFAQIIANTSQLLIELSEIITSYAAKIPISHLKGESVSAIAISISAFLIYLFFSKSMQQTIFRVIVSCICIIMMVEIFSEDATSTRYFKREQLEMLQVKRNTSRNDFIIISNSENLEILKKDYGLFNYIKRSADSSYIFIDKPIYEKTLNYPKIETMKFIFIENSTLKEKFFNHRK